MEWFDRCGMGWKDKDERQDEPAHSEPSPPSLYYRLVDGEPVQVPHEQFLDWAREFGDMDRHVARTAFGAVLVSTVFLGIDHNFTGDGPPILFETMVFDMPGLDRELQVRYATKSEAEVGHAVVVAFVEAELRRMGKEWRQT